MYSRKYYAEDGELKIPENYDGTSKREFNRMHSYRATGKG